MIKTSGYRVSSTEVEDAACSSGLVRDAVAFGVDDPRLGQRIVLLASPADGAELTDDQLVSAMCRLLPLYMVLSQVVVRTDLPRSPNEKVRLHPAEAGADRMTPADPISTFGTVEGELVVGRGRAEPPTCTGWSTT
jgi:acyl-CoA synthetase (AMP-forming)/AMP-acid ligase II